MSTPSLPPNNLSMGSTNAVAQSVFYAIAQSINDPTTNRAVFMFATRDAADRWWRAVYDVSKADQGSVYNNIRRLSPQYYAYDHTKLTLTNLVNQSTLTDPAMKKAAYEMVINMFNSGYPYYSSSIGVSIPPQPIVDRISGNHFYVRSTTDRSLFWFAPNDGHIHASNKERSRFCVSIAEGRVTQGRDENDGRIMLLTDKITMRLATLDNKSAYIKFIESGDLTRLGTGNKSSAAAAGYLFLGDLEGNIITYGVATTPSGKAEAQDSDNGANLLKVDGGSFGDVWELC